MRYKFYARLLGSNNEYRDFEILDFVNGQYMVYIDFIYPMQLSSIIAKAQLYTLAHPPS